MSLTYYWGVGKRCYRETSAKDFLSKWAASYSPHDKLETQYKQNIGWDEKKLRPDQLDGMWKWKSPQWSGRFSDRYLSKLDDFNAFRESKGSDLETFWEKVAQSISRTGFIYQAFAFHIARPQHFPIVDHHVLRAYLCMSSDPPQVVIGPRQTQTNCTSANEFRARYEPYRKFWCTLMAQLGLSPNNLIENRQLDTALRNFGIRLFEDYRPSNEFELELEKERL